MVYKNMCVAKGGHGKIRRSESLESKSERSLIEMSQMKSVEAFFMKMLQRIYVNNKFRLLFVGRLTTLFGYVTIATSSPSTLLHPSMPASDFRGSYMYMYMKLSQ